MPGPRNGEVRLPVDIPTKVRQLLEDVKEDTGQDLKVLVAWAVYETFANVEEFQIKDLRERRRKFKAWLAEEEPGPPPKPPPRKKAKKPPREKTPAGKS